MYPPNVTSPHLVTWSKTGSDLVPILQMGRRRRYREHYKDSLELELQAAGWLHQTTLPKNESLEHIQEDRWPGGRDWHAPSLLLA